MAGLEVKELESDGLAAWDELVAGSIQGTVFHTSGWLLRTASSLKRRLVILGCYEDEALIGGCPLLLSNPYRLLKVASPTVMFTPYGGVVVVGIESTKRREQELHNNKVIASIRDRIVRERFDHVNLVNSPGLEDIRSFTRNGWDAKVYYTYVLPVEGNVIERISKNARRSIHKAQKLGICATKHFDPEAYWNLMVNTFERQGSQPPISKEHLLGIMNLIEENHLGEMWVAKTPSQEIAAAEVIVYDSRTAHRWSAASSEEHLNTGAVSLLLGEIALDLAKRNYPSVNLMAGNVTHLSAFIASFNPVLVPYYGVERSRARYSILKQAIDGVRG